MGFNPSPDEDTYLPELDGIEHNIYVLGDTIIFTVDAVEKEKIIDLQYSIAIVLSEFIILGMKKEIFIRGAMSLGEYYISNDKRTIVGPAIKDVMEWSEATDWVGIVLTPATSFHFEKSKNKFSRCSPLIFKKTIVKLSPRFQRDINHQLWALTWPCDYHKRFLKKDWKIITEKDIKRSWELARDDLLDNLCLKRPVYAAIVSKYENTLAYFDSLKDVSIKHAVSIMKLWQRIDH